MYVWLGRRGGEMPPVKSEVPLCFCRWMGSAGRQLICLCDARHSLGILFASRPTNKIDIPPATRPLDCRIQSVIRSHLAHPLPSSTSTNTSNNTLHHPLHKMAIGHYSIERFVSCILPPRITIPLSTNNNNSITHPNIHSKDRNN